MVPPLLEVVSSQTVYELCRVAMKTRSKAQGWARNSRRVGCEWTRSRGQNTSAWSVKGRRYGVLIRRSTQKTARAGTVKFCRSGAQHVAVVHDLEMALYASCKALENRMAILRGRLLRFGSGDVGGVDPPRWDT